MLCIIVLSSEYKDMIDTCKEQLGVVIDPGQYVSGDLSKGIAASLSQTAFSIASFKGECFTLCL